MNWSCKYIGLSYDDYNCAEFVKLVLKKELKIDLMFPFDMPVRIDKQSDEIKKQLKYYVDDTPIEKPVDFDMVVMSARKRFCHIGLFVRINGQAYVLHLIGTLALSSLHRIVDLNRIGVKLEGFYKWKSFTGKI